MVSQVTQLFFTAFLSILGKHGHEGQGKCTFGKHAAEKIGDTKGDEKSIRHAGGTKHDGDNHIADIAKHPREQGESAENGRRFK